MNKLFVSTMAMLAISSHSAIAEDVAVQQTEKAQVINEQKQSESSITIDAKDLVKDPRHFVGSLAKDVSKGGFHFVGEGFAVRIPLSPQRTKALETNNPKEFTDSIVAQNCDPAKHAIIEQAVGSAFSNMSAETMDTLKIVSEYQTAVMGNGPEADKKPVTLTAQKSIDAWLSSTGLDKEVGDLKSNEKTNTTTVVMEPRVLCVMFTISPYGTSKLEIPSNRVNKELGLVKELSGAEKTLKSLVKQWDDEIGEHKPLIDQISRLKAENEKMNEEIETEKGKLTAQQKTQLSAAEKALDAAKTKANSASAGKQKDAAVKALEAAQANYDKLAPWASKSQKIKENEAKIAEVDKKTGGSDYWEKRREQYVAKEKGELEKVQKLFEDNIKGTTMPAA